MQNEPPSATGDSSPEDERTIAELGGRAAEIVREAGALLDEEVAAGIVAARNMQDRFRRERRVDAKDFESALRRFQSDGHTLVNVLSDQLEGVGRDENAALAQRLIENVHSLVDLAVGMVSLGSEVGNQLIEQANLRKRDDDSPRGPGA